MSGAGDVDGDNLDDVLIGAYNNDEGGTSAGAVYLILGGSLGENGGGDLSRADYKFVGEDDGDWAGIMVSGAGDVDGDGLDDVVIGAWAGPDWNGAAYTVRAGNIGNFGCGPSKHRHFTSELQAE